MFEFHRKIDRPLGAVSKKTDLIRGQEVPYRMVEGEVFGYWAYVCMETGDVVSGTQEVSRTWISNGDLRPDSRGWEVPAPEWKVEPA